MPIRCRNTSLGYMTRPSPSPWRCGDRERDPDRLEMMTCDDTFESGIAGHIDHGSPLLIGRLLYDTQSLPPDKMREAETPIRQDDGVRLPADHLEEETPVARSTRHRSFRYRP
jgi:hypothetical protein